MDEKIIGISTLSLLVTALIIIGGITLFDKDVYYCQATNTVMQCSKLSPYFGLENGKCYNPEGNKLCRTGWYKVVNDIDVNRQSQSKEVCDFEKCTGVN